MNPLLTVLATVSVLCAVGQEPEYQGKGLAEWKTRTRPPFSISERQEAILAMESIARHRMDAHLPHRESADVLWVASEIVPTLIELLNDKETAIKMRAAHALQRFREAGKHAAPVLARLLNDQDDEVRVVAAGALVSVERDEAGRVIPVLVKVVKGNVSRTVRQNAANVLATVGPDGIDALMAMFDDENADVRLVVVTTIHFHRGVPQQELPKFVKLLRDDNAAIRAGAVSIITDIHPTAKETVAALIPLLRDKNDYVRRTVVYSLGQMQDEAKQALPEMIKLVDDNNKYVRQNLAGSLRHMGPEAIPTLTKMLDDSDADVRARAADSLGALGPAAKDAAPALKRLLADMQEVGDEQGRVCNHAGKALAKILGDRRYLEGLPPMPLDGK